MQAQAKTLAVEVDLETVAQETWAALTLIFKITP
jgi:ppGpp synthetase/RelA/SpoT-type nucleotidyltranferase